MQQLLKNCLAALGLLLFAVGATAQCTTWNELDAAQKNEAENAHVVYRGMIKAKKFEDAFENWQKAYTLAPAADGQRSFHYSDGRDIYMKRLEAATDDAQKKEYLEVIMRLYDEQMECYPKEKAYLLADKGYNMYYKFNSIYSENLDVLRAAMNEGGNATLYTVLEPAATIAVYQFQNELLDKQNAIQVFDQINEIADYNKENNADYGQYYDDMRVRANAKFKEIEDQIFDCAYFTEILEPRYRENPDDLQTITFTYQKLKAQGCDESMPLLVELSKKYERMAAEINKQKEAELRANNPAYAAREAYKNENWQEALTLYEQAVAQETDNQKKSQYYFNMASIKFRKLNRYSDARNDAREAAKLRPGWGEPYMMIGDMYATSARNCGDNAYDRGLAVLAAIDKYSYAKSIDSSVAADANKSIGRMSGSKPPKEDVFMKGKQGGTDTAPCWIGETVQVRY